MRVFGLVLTAVFILFFAMAVLNYPNYNPFENYLSDLGVGQNSAVFFNLGSIITGTIGAIFSYYIIKERNGTIMTPGKVINNLGEQMPRFILLFANLSLVGVGVFPENTEFHELFAGLFFILYAIACPLLSYRKEVRILTRVLGFGVSLFAFAFIMLQAMSILEHIAVLLIGAWIVAFSFELP